MSNNTVFNYKGSVSVKLKINDKIIDLSNNHNDGTPALHKSFAMFLAGYESTDIPQCIVVKKQQGDLWFPITSEIELSGKTYTNIVSVDGDETYWVARFTAALKYKYLQEAIDEHSLYRLCMASKSNELATLSVEAEDLLRIQPGTQAIVEWTMQVIG